MNTPYPEIIFVCEDPSNGVLLVNFMQQRKPGLIVHMVEPHDTAEWDRIVKATIEKKKVVFASIHCQGAVKALELRKRPFSESMPWLLLLGPETNNLDPIWQKVPFAKVRLSGDPQNFYAQMDALESFLEICEYP